MDYLGFEIWHLSNLWQKQMGKELQGVNLTHVQFLILKSVYELEVIHEEKTQIKISKKARTNVMMTSKVIRSLEMKDFLKRDIHANDKRALRVSITKEGKKTLRKAINIVDEFEKKFFNKIEKKKRFGKEINRTAKANKENLHKS